MPPRHVLLVLVASLALLAPAAVVGAQEDSETNASDTESFEPNDSNETNETNETNRTDDHKVELCHNGHTIEVDENAEDAHLDHGDTEGPCEDAEGGASAVDIEEAASSGEVDIEIDIGRSVERQEFRQGHFVVRDVAFEDDGAHFVVVSEDDQTCSDGAVLLFDLDRTAVVATTEETTIETEGDVTYPQFVPDENETDDNETNESDDDPFDEENTSGENETNESDDVLFSDDENDSENLSENGSEADVEISVEIDSLEVERVETVNEVVVAESGAKFLVVEDADVFHVLVFLDDVCEPREAALVTTQSAGLGSDVEVPGPNLLFVAGALLGAAAIVAALGKRD